MRRIFGMQLGALSWSLLALAVAALARPALAADGARHELAAGASAEAQAGVAPRTGLGSSSAALIGTLRLSAGWRRTSALEQTTVRYMPRLWYRPQVISPERPLLFHQLSVAHARTLDRRSQVSLTLDSALGELAYSASGTGPLGNSYAGLATATYSVASVTSSAEWQYRVDRRSALGLEARGSYSAPVPVGVLPGLSSDPSAAQSGAQGAPAGLPKSGAASLTTTLGRRETRRLRLTFPVDVGLYASDVVGVLGTTAARAGAGYDASPRTQLTAEVGATYVATQRRATSPWPVFPVAQLGVQHAFYDSEATEWSAGATASHTGYFDTIQGAYLPVAGLGTTARTRQGDVTVSLDVQVSMLTNTQLYPNESRSYLNASLPVTIRLGDAFDLSFGGRASARSREFPFGPVDPQQVRLLAFVGLAAVTGTEPDARWAL